jgi:RND family efflux transporter MFP subunit
MTFSSKTAAMAAGFAAVLTVMAFRGQTIAQAPRGDSGTLVVDDATVDWIERSNVAALREGVIERMELEIGDPVAKDGVIGQLHSEIADLTVKKALVAVNSIGPKERAKAQEELSLAVVARNIRLNERIKGAVSIEEVQKAEAELKVSRAMKVEADEKYQLDKAELDLARRTLEEHTIRAPFEGVVIERMKHPGESVRANEAVVMLGNLNKLRAYAYIPLQYAYRVKEGQIVEIQPKLAGGGGGNAPLAIEQKRVRGKITFVDPQIQPVAETAVRIFAEFENKERELSPGLKGTLTIYLGSEGASATQAVGSRTVEPIGR